MGQAVIRIVAVEPLGQIRFHIDTFRRISADFTPYRALDIPATSLGVSGVDFHSFGISCKCLPAKSLWLFYPAANPRECGFDIEHLARPYRPSLAIDYQASSAEFWRVL